MGVLPFFPALKRHYVTDSLEARLCYQHRTVNGERIHLRIWEAVVPIMCKHTHRHTGVTQKNKPGSVSKVIAAFLLGCNVLMSFLTAADCFSPLTRSNLDSFIAQLSALARLVRC